MNINIIFPMAGEGARFGYTFKPFLKATEDTFIQLAKKPFEQLKNYGYTYKLIFTYRYTQEKTYNVSQKLEELFPDEEFDICLINNSDGPLQTLQQTVLNKNLKGPTFVCDCDHSIDILPIIQNIDSLLLNYDVIIPTWNITNDQQSSFGKVILNATTDKITGFCEKELIEVNTFQYVKGILGCYLFKDISIVSNYDSYNDISSLLKESFINKTLNLQYIDIQNADFFGTPKQLEHFRFNRTKQYSIIVDIDGTLINQETKELLHGSIEKLKEWKSKGHTIVLSTASSSKNMKKYILQYNIPYDQIIYNLTPGPRIVINDKKPYLPFYCMADGININRNTGISQIDIEKYDPPVILETFKGASMAKVYKVSKNNNIFIRKYIHKTSTNEVHVETLKRQYEDLKRWSYYAPELTPNILNVYESPNEYYYDLEYCDNYKPLSCYDESIINTTLVNVVRRLYNDIYVYKKPIKYRTVWLNTYLDTKVYPKFSILLNLDTKIDYLLKYNTIVINNITYEPIKKLLEKSLDTIHNYAPYFECPIHGDLSLENILYNSEMGTFKLIDNAGSRYIDAVEMDIAKIFQSVICKFSEWDDDMDLCDFNTENTETPLNNYNISSKYILDTYNKDIEKWLKLYETCEGIDFIYKKGLFYMSTYFIRMVPFMFEKSVNHAIFILLLSHIYLNKSLK